MLMLLGSAVGSGEVLAEPAAGARFGGRLAWCILFIVATKALWNEVVGRVAIATGQNFLDSCSAAGPLIAWVPWLWYGVNVLKDFFLRGGIAAVAGLICYDSFGALPFAPAGPEAQAVSWTLLNYAALWLLVAAGGYRLAERINTVLCLLFTLALAACAAAVLPGAAGELAAGLVPSFPSERGELLMALSLSGIVMSGSTTVYYSAWAEERRMGLFSLARAAGRCLERTDAEPRSPEEVKRMHRWLRINRVNVALTYGLGALVCLSTFILGVTVLRPAGVTLQGAALAPELSLMVTRVAGPWAKAVFYLGAWAAVASTVIGVLDGGSRMYVQPLRRVAPHLFARFSFGFWQRGIMTLMVAGCWTVYLVVPDALRLVVWLGAVDAPLVGILIAAYAYLGRRYLPEPYRSGRVWTAAMVLIALVYLGGGVWFLGARGLEALSHCNRERECLLTLGARVVPRGGEVGQSLPPVERFDRAAGRAPRPHRPREHPHPASRGGADRSGCPLPRGRVLHRAAPCAFAVPLTDWSDRIHPALNGRPDPTPRKELSP